MSTISEKNVSVGGKNYKVMIESYNSANEVARDCETRTMTDSSFYNVKKCIDWDWRGVKSYDEALEFLRNGYQPTVDALKGGLKASKLGASKRITFANNIVGMAPVVPLAMQGVPNCMVDMRMKPIKAKVLDIYYDITVSVFVDADDIIKAGQKLLGAIIALEQQGYKFNVYAWQAYSDNDSSDILCVKIKSSGQPIDLKRMSFALTHVGFFRVIGFDWYSKTPKGKYRGGYGSPLKVTVGAKRDEFVKKILGENAVYVACSDIVYKKNGDADEYVRGCLTNGKA